jgi:SH3 domain-containing YSC84-like protein 1
MQVSPSRPACPVCASGLPVLMQPSPGKSAGSWPRTAPPCPLASHCFALTDLPPPGSFVDPKQSFGPDKVIPPSVLSNAKGLVVITVIKVPPPTPHLPCSLLTTQAGFLFSGRAGSGLVVARLPDGCISTPLSATCRLTPPSLVCPFCYRHRRNGLWRPDRYISSNLILPLPHTRSTLQPGAEVTDFVMILNDNAAVKAFQQFSSVTLGGNLSIAAGPVGRNAEASGAANFKSIAPVFSYSKTKGLFAGVSLEGSILFERRDANRKFYNAPVNAKQLLTGQVPPPPGAEPLYRILNTRSFSGDLATGDDIYNDIPVFGDNEPSEDGWGGDDGYSRQSPSERNRSASIGRYGASRGGGGVESWRNNYSDEVDDLDDYDRQENRYRRSSTYVHP